MRPATARRRMVFTLLMALGMGCSPIRKAGANATATPLALSRCAEAAGILCIATFGMLPEDRMLVAVSAPVGGLSEIQLQITHRGKTSAFPCIESPDSADSFNCTGPQIPLGSTIRVDVQVAGSAAIVASGEFFLAGFAVPTARLATPPAPGTASPGQ